MIRRRPILISLFILTALACGVLTRGELPQLKSVHPLEGVLRWAEEAERRIERDVHGYSCILVKRERIDGELSDYEFMFAKVRHERPDAPFGVYLKFLAPKRIKNREVLYVEGENDGKLVARNGGRRFAYITTSLDPLSELAMRDNRHPITDIGIQNLLRRLIETAHDEIAGQPVVVEMFKNARVDNRSCTGIVVRQEKRTEKSTFFFARVYIDNELEMPIHYEAFDWPDEDGGEPVLLEQYTYRDIRINPGLRDIDFRRDNPQYGFR